MSMKIASVCLLPINEVECLEPHVIEEILSDIHDLFEKGGSHDALLATGARPGG